MDLRSGPMQAIEFSFLVWLAFGLWWWRYSIQNYNSKVAATSQAPQIAKYVAVRVVVWLAAGAGILFVVVYVSNTLNAGMR